MPDQRIYVGHGTEAWFTYTNHRGETHDRHVLMYPTFWGTTEHHQEPQFIMSAFDLDKGGWRLFAVRDIANLRGSGWPALVNYSSTWREKPP